MGNLFGQVITEIADDIPPSVYYTGTLNHLIIRMTDKAFNSDLMAFLVGYDLFSDSKEVWSKIEEQYFVPKFGAKLKNNILYQSNLILTKPNL